MSTNIHPNSPVSQISEAAREAARKSADIAHDATDAAREAGHKLSSRVDEGVERTKEYAHDAIDATREAAHRASDKAADIYQSATLKAEDTLATSREYVRQNPLSVVLGAVALGAAIGYLVVSARRKPTFGERFADEPLGSIREAILASLAPVARSVHDGYDSARDGMGKAMDRAHRFSPGDAVDSISDRIGRVGSNLKFW